MASLDTLQELFVSMDSRIDARLSKMETQLDDLTFYVQQLPSWLFHLDREEILLHQLIPT